VDLGFRRVITALNPALPGHDKNGTVHFQPCDGSAPCRSSSHDPGKFVYPFKMLVPALRAWIEQRNLGHATLDTTLQYVSNLDIAQRQPPSILRPDIRWLKE
jgi:hypothetical protein